MAAAATSAPSSSAIRLSSFSYPSTSAAGRPLSFRHSLLRSPDESPSRPSVRVSARTSTKARFLARRKESVSVKQLNRPLIQDIRQSIHLVRLGRLGYWQSIDGGKEGFRLGFFSLEVGYNSRFLVRKLSRNLGRDSSQCTSLISSLSTIARLIALIPYYIDRVGCYKLSPQARSKTEAARTKAAQEAYKDLQNARQEALQKRKADRNKMLEEAEAKLGAEALRKKEFSFCVWISTYSRRFMDCGRQIYVESDSFSFWFGCPLM